MWGALFPGQGSQSVGMGKFLFEEFATARRLFEEASDTLSINFKKLCFDGPIEDLQLTENTQPALLLVSTVTSQVLSEVVPIKFEGAAGHSIGEYPALVMAGVITFADGMRAVRLRGQSMQRAVPVGEGGMCAVLGLNDDAVIKLCNIVEKSSGEKPLEPANFNSPGQVVVSGSAKAIEWMRTNVKADWLTENIGPESGRVKLIPLNVSAPFHCSLMKPAETEMRDVLESISFSAPRMPVVQNLSAEISADPKIIRERLIGQISGAVLWTQCQQLLLSKGCTKYVELGSGKVLSGLAKKIAGDRATVYGMNSIDDLKTLEGALKEA